MKKINILMILAICFTFIVGCGDSSVEKANYPTPEKPLTLKLGHIAPERSDMHVNSMALKKYVEEKTEGAVLIQVYPNGQLGNEDTLMDSIFTGTLDMGLISANVATTVIPEFNALCLPFFFDSFDQVGKVVTSEEFYSKTSELIKTKGVHYLGLPLIAARGLLNTKKTVLTPKDLIGLKVRVNSGAIITDMFDAMGVTTTQLAFGEVYTALQQGVVDGLDNGIFISNIMKFTEVAKYFTDLKHIFQLSPLLVSDNSWAKLSEAQHLILRDGVKYVESFVIEEAIKSDTKAYKIAQEKYGVKSVELSTEEFRAFRATVDSVYKKYIPIIGQDYYNFVEALK